MDMKRTTQANNVKVLRAAFPECSVTLGWHLAGPGPARFGWGARYPSGKVRFLGRTAYNAVQGLLREIDERTAECLATD